MPGFLSAVSPGITVSTGATRLYYMCFLVGSLISALVFVGLHHFVPAKAHKAWVEQQQQADGGKWREVMMYYREKWDALAVVQGSMARDADIKGLDETVKEV
jgi:hypothetical protein